MSLLCSSARLTAAAACFALIASMCPGEQDDPAEADGKAGGALGGLLAPTWQTRQEVRSLNLEIPPPRGQIIDRNGLPLATNGIFQFLALQLPGEADLPDDQVLAFAKDRIGRANDALEGSWEIDEEKVLNHYRNRRWMMLPFSLPLDDEQLGKIGSELDEGLVLFPTYSRTYPHGEIAGHIIGYAGRKAAMPTGVPVIGEPIFPFSEGREGLEASFEAVLQGQPGQLHRVYGEDGKLLMEEMLKRPVPGGHLVTTLDLGMQKLAEETLAQYSERGAFVVLDIRNGDVLAMASRPGYDPNVFLPYITEERFAELRDDPEKPLFPRAFAGTYPPASTFKVVTALAGLEAGVVDGDTLIDSPAVLTIHGRKFRNWSKDPEGEIDVERALARSCNTWFYQVGMDTGAEAFCSIADRFGFGVPTGLPLLGEVGGMLPTDEWTREKFGYGLADGYLANAAIGQGEVLATPLQVAQMMAGVANRRSLPQVRLVAAVQDIDGRVMRAFPSSTRNDLEILSENLDLVTTGLVQVVHADFGTGKGAANGFQTVAGKTGTGQWGAPSKEQYVAWFAGFVPAHDPKYAFAALYEGKPGETLSGGRKAAPIVASFFKSLFGGAADRTNSAELAKYGTPLSALAAITAEQAVPVDGVLAALDPAEGGRERVVIGPDGVPIAAPAPGSAPRAGPKKPGGRGVLSRLFGKRKR